MNRPMHSGADQQLAILPDILITPELATRPCGPPDFAAENRALIELAREMAARPQNLPQKLTDLALALCRAGSAGISALRTNAQGAYFHWQALSGAFAPHAGGSTPYDFSPYGATLTRGVAQLFSHPARHFDYLSAIEPPVIEALVVPVYANGESLAAIWVLAHDPQRRFNLEDARILQSLGDFTGAALRTLSSLDSERRAHEKQIEANAALQQEIHRRQLGETALKVSEERYRTLFESIDEGFCVIEMLFDDNGAPVDFRFLEVNPSFEKQTGLNQAVNKTARELVPTLEAHWFETYGKVALTGEPVRFENVADTMNRWFDVYAFRVGTPASRKVAIYFKDSTGRMRAAQTLRKQHERQRMLSEAAGMLLSTADADALFPGLFAKIARHLDVDAYCNFMVNEARDAISVESSQGLPEAALHALMRLKFRQDLHDGIVLSDRPLVLTNMQQSEDREEHLLNDFGFRACTCHPLMLDDRLLGVLWFASRARNSFDEGELEFLKTITRYVTVAHERLQLIERLRESDRHKDEALEQLMVINSELDRRVLERTRVADKRATQLRALASELTLAEERERQNLAADLHDSLAQDLTLATFKLAGLEPSIRDEGIQQAVRSIRKVLSQASQSVRSHIFSLSPPVLKDLGLTRALESLAENLHKTAGLKVTIRHDGAVQPLDERIRFTLFRAARELLINVIKHAGIDRATLSLTTSESHLRLTVEDRGAKDLTRTGLRRTARAASGCSACANGSPISAEM